MVREWRGKGGRKEKDKLEKGGKGKGDEVPFPQLKFLATPLLILMNVFG